MLFTVLLDFATIVVLCGVNSAVVRGTFLEVSHSTTFCLFLARNTPLVRLASLSDKTGCEILAKAEW